MANTCTELSDVLKEAWNVETFMPFMPQFDYNIQAYKKAVILEREALVNEYREKMNRQFVSGTQPNFYYIQNLSTNPTQHRVRMEEMKQRIALLERKGKPSYRQRQRNGRAARRA